MIEDDRLDTRIIDVYIVLFLRPSLVYYIIDDDPINSTYTDELQSPIKKIYIRIYCDLETDELCAWL